VRDIARPHLRRLNEISGQTVHLATLIDREVIYIDKYEGNSPIRMYSRVGKVASMSTSGIGKVILAFQEEPHLRGLIQLIDFRRHTPETIVTEQALCEELATIRERGYGVDRGEFEGLINCIAAPIHAADGSVSSAVSISVATMVVTLDELLQLLPALTDATDAISAAYGWTGAHRRGSTADRIRDRGELVSPGLNQVGADIPTTHGGVNPLAVDKRA
jgi:DNA-binding IclR family transcriptional regulator